MPIPVICLTCNSRVRLPDNAAGKRFRCPKCQGVITGPAPAPPAATKPAVIRPPDQTDAGFADTPADPSENQIFGEPAPISSLARKATQPDFNPFVDGTSTDDEEKPRNKRYYKPKDDYNPFAEPPASSTGNARGDPGQPFDFGAAEPTEPAGGGEFSFGPDDDSEDREPRRRRR